MQRKFDLNDILLTPEQTDIESRSDVSIFDKEFDKLPVFTAPMDTVVNSKNIQLFLDNNIIPVLPRVIDEEIDLTMSEDYFRSYSLTGAKRRLIYLSKIAVDKRDKEYWCIDIANGHMTKLLDLVKEIKQELPHIKIMTGNVATPEGYKELSEAGADYVRVSIGSGSGCLTSTHTAVGYPIGSLIEECYKISLELENPACIIADGGMKNYSDIIKALALGADYVMLGGIFNKTLESCGKTTFLNFEIDQHSKIAQYLFDKGYTLKKKFRGMSTKEVQRAWGRKKLRSAEGIIRENEVEYTLDGWTNNFKDYLRSSMSYKNCKYLKKFQGSAIDNGKVFLTKNAFERINK